MFGSCSLLYSKAAVRTGIHILCEKYGLESLAQIDKVFLAGGMGYYLSPKAAARIGLLPAELAGKTVAVGNAALEGAFWYGRRILWQEISAAGENTAAGKPPQTGICSALGDSGFVKNHLEHFVYKKSTLGNC